MKARSVARELALFVLFQLEKKEDSKLQWDKASLQDIVTNTIRSLSSLAVDQIASISQEIADLREYLVYAEIDHPLNKDIPLESPTVPVPIPTTREMADKLESLLKAVENLQEAVYFPEISALSRREEVRNYCLMLVRSVVSHQAEIDGKIDSAAQDWRLERLQKMDLMLMRLALAEILYAENVDAATVVDEVLELAKRFTSEESRKFIHGILGGIAQLPTEVTEGV